MLAISSTVWTAGAIAATVLAVLIGIVPGMIGHCADKRRTAGLPAFAAKINAAYLERDDTVLHWFAKTPFWPDCDYAVAVGVMRGIIWEVHVIFFDLEAVSKPGVDSTFIDKQTVAMFHFGEGGMPAFTLRPFGKDSRIGKLLGSHDQPRLAFEDGPGFSEKFRITGDDVTGIKQLFTAKLRAFIDAHNEWSVESTGTWIAICRLGKQSSLEEYHSFIDEASEFLRAFGTRG